MLTTLNLTGVALVGFSMGTGEVTRYMGKYGTKRVRKAAPIGTLGPFLPSRARDDEAGLNGLGNRVGRVRPGGLEPPAS